MRRLGGMLVVLLCVSGWLSAAETDGTAAELAEAEQEFVQEIEAGKRMLVHAGMHAKKLNADKRKPFLQAALQAHEKRMAALQDGDIAQTRAAIAEVETQLAWDDEKLQELVEEKTPAEIRAALKAKLGAEKMKLKSLHSQYTVLGMQRDTFRKRHGMKE